MVRGGIWVGRCCVRFDSIPQVRCLDVLWTLLYGGRCLDVSGCCMAIVCVLSLTVVDSTAAKLRHTDHH